MYMYITHGNLDFLEHMTLIRATSVGSLYFSLLKVAITANSSCRGDCEKHETQPVIRKNASQLYYYTR